MADEEDFSQEELDALEGEDGTEGEGQDDQLGPEGDEGSEQHSDEGEGESQGEVTRQTQTEGRDGGGRETRGNARLRRLKERTEKAEREAAETRRQLDAITAQQRQQQYQEDPRLEAERLSAMSETEQLRYHLDKSNRLNEQRLNAMALHTADQNDRNAFRMRAQTDKRAAKYEPEVEQNLALARQNGMNPSRETIYFYLLGRKVADARAKLGGGAPRKEAAARVQRQATRPGNSSGDAGGRPRTGKTLEDRLDGQPI